MTTPTAEQAAMNANHQADGARTGLVSTGSCTAGDDSGQRMADQAATPPRASRTTPVTFLTVATLITRNRL